MPGLFQVRFCISSPVFPCILIRNAQNSVCTLISSSFYPCICPENVDVAEQSVHLNCNTFHCKFALYLICSKSYWLKNKYKIRHWLLIKPDNCGVDYKCTRAEHLLKFLLNYIEKIWERLLSQLLSENQLFPFFWRTVCLKQMPPQISRGGEHEWEKENLQVVLPELLIIWKRQSLRSVQDKHTEMQNTEMMGRTVSFVSWVNKTSHCNSS